MLDPKFVYENQDIIYKNVAKRKSSSISLETFRELYKQKLSLQSRIEELQVDLDKVVDDKALHCVTENDVAPSKKEQSLRTQINSLIVDIDCLSEQINESLKWVPNLIHPDTPTGGDENNIVLSVVGEAPTFNFSPRDHMTLGTSLGIVDFINASKVSGSRFYYLLNEGALLELALINFTISKLISKGFIACLTPDLARASILEKTGFITEGKKKQVYAIEDNDLFLVATSEITLGGMLANETIDFSKLPLYLAGISHCFRTEVDATEDDDGLFRVHQFTKVEMFAAADPQDSELIHQNILNAQIEIYKELGLHFRVLELASENLDGTGYRKYDLEVWIPSKGRFGEITSASNCLDYQSRRLNIKFKDSKGDIIYVHTLNGTACATSRVIMAIIENFQQEDGSVLVPESLQPFLYGQKVIQKNSI